MKVLGLHSAGHDTGACLFDNGQLVYSIETERISRRKHDHRAALALDDLFTATGLSIDDIDVVAIGLNLRQDVVEVEDWPRPFHAITPETLHVEARCGLLGGSTPCLLIAHEACHAALAVHYTQSSEPCLVLTNEGRGSFGRCSFFLRRGSGLEHLGADFLPWYGTGFGWSALGFALGFGKSPSVAGTLMGMAGHGAPDESIRQVILGVPRDLHVRSVEDKEREMQRFLAALDLPDPSTPDGFARQARVVATFQELFTQSVLGAVEQRLTSLADANGAVRHLGLAGGCALNVVCNSVVRGALPVRLAIPPAPNDAGIALGAAVYAHLVHLERDVEPFSVYSNGSPEPSDDAAAALRAHGLEPRPFDPEHVAATLADGHVVAWIEGRSEIGPRALGQRSLLGNAGHAGMKKRLSESIKRRQWFRPLAPIMREERFRELLPDEHPSPHMLFAYPADGLGIDEGIHVDGSARIQTLTPADHPRLHDVLERFERQSGVPALINTSLNRRGRAIAQSTSDCLDDFPDGEVDLVVSGDWMAASRT
ncbi:MAG: carbamoyltransferase C-terminal domain-containing protein [Acidobacteriota bacterium]